MEQIKKTCSKCNLEKDLITGFYLHKHRDSFSSTCFDCRSENNRKRYKERREKVGKIVNHSIIKGERIKICNLCKEEKILNNENFRFSNKCFSNICIKCVEGNYIRVTRTIYRKN